LGLYAFFLDDGKEEFSVEVHHGGFFVGHGYLRSYVSGKVSWFDHVETDTWSPLWLDQFVEDLGYLRTGNLKIYWLLPGKEISGSQMLPHLSSTQLSQMMQEVTQLSQLSLLQIFVFNSAAQLNSIYH